MSQPARVDLPVQDERGHRLAGRRRPPLPRRGGRGALRRRGAVLRAHGRLGGEGLQHRGHVHTVETGYKVAIGPRGRYFIGQFTR